MKIRVLSLVAALAAAGSASADLVAYWNFNNSTASTTGGLGVLNSFSADQGTGTLSTNFSINTVAGTNAENTGDLGTFAGSTVNAISPDAAGGALAFSAGNRNGGPVTNNGKYVQFQINMASFGDDLVLTYATRNTGTGFQNQAWSYSTDGVNFTTLTTVSGLTTTFALKTVDFTAANLGGFSTVYLRATVDGASNTSGNNRIDNVQFNASAVPAPGVLALAGMGGVVALRRRRR